ncbi:hypothetical protein OUHCRE17_14390 [Enterobacter hormaechei subsp. steigerwaltii]|nr:hypothetical protein CSB67_2825 [Enterobacter hormaechei]
MRSLVTEMTDPGDELQASHPLRDAKVVVEDIEDKLRRPSGAAGADAVA